MEKAKSKLSSIIQPGEHKIHSSLSFATDYGKKRQLLTFITTERTFSFVAMQLCTCN